MNIYDRMGKNRMNIVKSKEINIGVDHDKGQYNI